MNASIEIFKEETEATATALSSSIRLTFYFFQIFDKKAIQTVHILISQPTTNKQTIYSINTKNGHNDGSTTKTIASTNLINIIYE